VRTRVLLNIISLDGSDGLRARPCPTVLLIECHAWEIYRLSLLHFYWIQLDSVLFKWGLTREPSRILQIQLVFRSTHGLFTIIAHLLRELLHG